MILSMKIKEFKDKKDLVQYLSGKKGTVLLLGPTDSGKTTFAMELAKSFLQKRNTVSLIDSDIGQSTIGPPATIGARLLRDEKDIGSDEYAALYFVGEISPDKNLLDMVMGTYLLACSFQKKADCTVIDTTGLVAGKNGFYLKYNKIRMIRPEYVVIFQKKDDLSFYADLFPYQTNIQILRLKVQSKDIKEKDAIGRKKYRTEKLLDYFKKAKEYRIETGSLFFMPPDQCEIKKYDMVGLEDKEHTLKAIGIFLSFEGQYVKIFSKITDIKKIHYAKKGSLNLKDIYRYYHNL
jgi:polynucleotide 5'-kinase involved in rRNA processing